MRLLSPLLLVLALALPAPGQDPAPEDPHPSVRYSLEDCRRLALGENLDLAYSRLEPLLYEGDLVSFRGGYDPILYLDSTRSNAKSPTASSLAGASVLDTDSWNTSFGVKGTLLTGAVWDLNVQADRRETNNAFSTLNPTWDASYGVSLRQPLLRAAWAGYALIPARISRLSWRSSHRHVEQDTQKVVYDVELAYWALVNAIRQLEVKQRALDLAQRLYEVNRNKVAAGALAPIEELRAETEVAAQQEGIILARNAIDEAQDGLKRLIRPFERPSDWEFVIIPVDEPSYVPMAVNLDAAVSEAVLRRPEVEQSRLSVESSVLTEKLRDNEALPTVDVTGSYRYAGLGRNLGDSLEGVGSSDFDTWSLGVSVQYPLFSRASRGAAARAAVETRRARVALLNQEQTIVVEVRSAVREMSSVEKRIEATKAATRLAQRSLEAEQARFDRGLSTSHQVFEFQKLLTEAESNEAKAVVDWKIALAKYRKATGTILESR
jgi:HAE1 family hydrophobic/amphiphilic exporter-1